MFRGRLFWQIFLGSAAVLGLAAVIGGLVATLEIEDETRAATVRDLEEQALLLREVARRALAGEDGGALQARLHRLAEEGDKRYTVLRADGTVIADSERDPATLDNHGRRPEVLASKEQPFGVATRWSASVRDDLVYVACRVEEQGTLVGFVRAAVRLRDLDRRLDRLDRMILQAGVLAMLVCLGVSLLLARRVAAPVREMTRTATAIAAGDLDRPVATSVPGEVGDLARAFRRMTDQLRERLRTLAHDQQELRAILAGMVEGVLATDHDERIVLLNDAAAAMLGVDGDAARGRPVWEAIRVPPVPETLAAAVTAGRPQEAEARVVGEEGAERVLQLRAAPLRGEGGEAAGAVLVLHDITELRRLETVRRDFVANASHELRTPISSIRGLVETVLEDEAMERETERRFLQRALRQAEYLGNMVEELLALSRLESEPEPGPGRVLDLADPVREAVDAAAPIARERDVAIRVDLPDGRIPVRGRAEALRRIVANLLDNAIKYGPPGTPVSLRVVPDEGQVLLEVADRGPGIPPDKQKRIFERFYRVDEGRSRDVGGTGLGLAIVKHLVQAMQGRVGVRSAPGQGSTFWVSLPRA